MSKYYSIYEFSKILGVSAQTLRNWDNNEKLKPYKLMKELIEGSDNND